MTGKALSTMLLVCAISLTAATSDNATTPSSSPDVDQVQYIPATRPAFTEHLCCTSDPYNVTTRLSFVEAVEQPYTRSERYLYRNRCPFFPNSANPWCKVYRWRDVTDYRLVTTTVYKTVVREIYCMNGHEVCCEGYIRDPTSGDCINREEQSQAAHLNELIGYFLNGQS